MTDLFRLVLIWPNWRPNLTSQDLINATQQSYISLQGCQIWHLNTVRLATYGTNLGFFQIRISTFWRNFGWQIWDFWCCPQVKMFDCVAPHHDVITSLSVTSQGSDVSSDVMEPSDSALFGEWRHFCYCGLYLLPHSNFIMYVYTVLMMNARVEHISKYKIWLSLLI